MVACIFKKVDVFFMKKVTYLILNIHSDNNIIKTMELYCLQIASQNWQD